MDGFVSGRDPEATVMVDERSADHDAWRTHVLRDVEQIIGEVVRHTDIVHYQM